LRAVPLERAIGKRLARTLYSSDGRVLLHAGTVLTDTYVQRLKLRGYISVYIMNELVPDLVVNDAITEVTRVKAMTRVSEAMAAIARGERIERGRVIDVVRKIISDLAESPDVLFCLSNIRSMDDYTFAHSVNVCVLAVMIGQALHFARSQLERLGVGALLHDIGKVKVPKSILQKPGRLTPHEFEVVMGHAEEGFNILRRHFDFSLFSAHVAFQHHERLDGTGYPRGLKGDAIHPFGRITAVADVYDAVTSDRVYRAKMPPHEALRMLKVEGKGRFDQEVVNKLMARVAAYPTGCIVKLSTGQLAVVVQQVAHAPDRPIVRVVTDDKYRVIEPEDLPLESCPEVTIEAVLDDFPNQVLRQLRAPT